MGLEAGRVVEDDVPASSSRETVELTLDFLALAPHPVGWCPNYSSAPKWKHNRSEAF